MRQRDIDLPTDAGEAVLVSGLAGGTEFVPSTSNLTAAGRLLALLTLEAAAFAFAGASGKMPEVVIRLFRALLTL